MSRAPRLRALGLVALLALLFAPSCARVASPARDHIRFSHGPHLRASIACLDCHAGVDRLETDSTSVSAHRPSLPSEQRCRSCHTAPEQQRCEYCHTAPTAPMRYLRADRELFFSHPNHQRRVMGGQCVTCHGEGASSDSVRRFEPRIPDMAGCVGNCHGQDMRAMNCTRCHASLRRYPMEEVALVRHRPGFARHHGDEARAQVNTCTQCHEPTFCARCHSGAPGIPLADTEPMSVTRDFVHRGDFMARHPDEARFNTMTCQRCHGVDFCNGCHRASGIGGGVGPSATHPPGWLLPGSANGHARAARRNLLSCVSCHESDATQVCTPCHRAGGIAPSPHPPGFRAGIDQNQHAVCLACHGGAP